MSEQVSLSFTILPDGSLTACVSAMPYIDQVLVPENQTSAVIGLHNSAEEVESKFLAAIQSAIIEFRTSKGI